MQIEGHFNYLLEKVNSYQQLRHDISFKIITGRERRGAEKHQPEVQEAPETQEVHDYANHRNPAAEMPFMTV